MISKTALVTGAGRGIGSAIALALGQIGWQIIVNYRSDVQSALSTAADVTAVGGKSHVIQADISLTSDRAHLVEETLKVFGRIDLLVNNAGMAPRSRTDLLSVTEESYDEVMQTNLKGPFFLTQMVAKQMLKQSDSSTNLSPKIVNIGSMSAYTTSQQRGEYCLSKAGMGMMTALFADRLAVHGILVYEIRPGIIETDMTAGVHEKYDDLIKNGLLPIPRWGKAEDVARSVVAIAEGYLPYSTGEIIHVDGGFHLRRL